MTRRGIDAAKRSATANRSRFRLAFAATLCFIALAAAESPAQIRIHSPSRSVDALQFQDAFWIATDRGLLRYRGIDNTWSFKGAESGLPSSGLTRLHGDDEVLWIGSDKGIARYDPRKNASSSWGAGSGVPPGRALCIASGAECVWIGTENGAARFDKLIEQWQSVDAAHGLTGRAVFAILEREDRAWLATDSAVCEYDPRYERWRTFRPPREAGPLVDAFAAGAHMWLLTEKELLRFDPAACIFRRYPSEEAAAAGIKTIFIDGASFWISTGDDLLQYDAQSDSFRPFPDIVNLPDRNIQAVGMAGSADIWFATAAGLIRYENRSSGETRGKIWTPVTAAGGLPFSRCEHLFPVAGGLIAFAENILAVWRAAEARWHTFPLPEARAEDKAPFIVTDPAKGVGFEFAKGWKLSFAGSRASWLITEPFGDAATARNFDLKARLELGPERSISASYNDVDYTDVRMGAEYRGASKDLVQVLQAGDARVEQGARSLLQPIGIYGGAGRIDIGARTPKYNRPLVELSGSAGHQTTAVVTDVFVGGNTAKSYTISARDFRRREFFRLDDGQGDLRVQASPFDLFLEQTPGSPPTHNALADETIAGKTATWLRLEALRDYSLDAERGIVRLAAPAGAAALAARFTEGGLAREAILYSPADTAREMRNVYFVGARNIIPRTFVLQQTAPEWELDRDGDGRVDAEFMDYENGFIRFPAAVPFSQPGTTIQAAFMTATPSYTLSETRLIRGSERLLVDGRLVKAGEDYVLDYTSGSLSFTRDGVVLDDSRIEITYEHVSNESGRRYLQAGAVVSPSDFMQASITAGTHNFNGNQNLNGSSTTTFVHASTEARVQSGLLDLRIVPEYSYAHSRYPASDVPADESTGNAIALFTAASYGPARITLKARKWDPEYNGIFRREYAGGELLNQSSIEGEIDVTPTLRLFGSWQGRGNEDGWKMNESTLDGGVRWFDTKLPSVTLRFTRGVEDYGTISGSGGNLYRAGKGVRNTIRTDAQYAAAPAVLKALGLSSANLVSYIRYSADEHPPASALPSAVSPDSTTHLNVYLRINASPRPMFAISAYYRGDRQYGKLKDEELMPVAGNERLYVDAVMEHIEGISATLRYVDDLRLLYTPGEALSWNADSKRSAQLGTRLAPGVLTDELKPFTLELNARLESQEYLSGGRDGMPVFLSHFMTRDGSAERRTTSSFLESRLEWRPAPGFLGTTTARFTENRPEVKSSTYTDRRRDLIQRVDIQAGSASLYTLQLAYADGKNPWSDYRRITPNFRTEQRWGGYLLARFTISGLGEIRRNGADILRSGEAQPGGSLTLQLHDLAWLPKSELRYDLSLRYAETEADPSGSSLLPERIIARGVTNAISLDVYPFASSYLRFVFSSTLSASSPSGIKTATTASTLQIVLQL